MPVRRTPDGKIIEEKTKLQRPGSARSEGPTKMDPSSTGRANAPTGGSRFDAETKVVPRAGQGTAPAGGQPADAPSAGSDASKGAPANSDASADKNRTRLVGFGSSQPDATGESAPGVATQNAPVTGWLVVVNGPGRGHFAALGLGRNSVGRGPESRVCLDFGDDTISRDSHIVISYDHRGRKFYMQSGEGQNLSYVDNQPVLNTVELQDGALIALGDTEVKFVAFCGDDFDWAESE